jgi:hypothetical protein
MTDPDKIWNFILDCMNKPTIETPANYIELPNGHWLYWEDNGAGGRTYWSDEIGDGVIVWDTSAVSRATIEAALRQEDRLNSLDPLN